MVLSTAGGWHCALPLLTYKTPKRYATRTFPCAFQQHSKQIRQDDYESMDTDSSAKTIPRRRMVSCTRSFPPNCGRYASDLAMEDNVDGHQECSRTDTSVIDSERIKGLKVETECQGGNSSKSEDDNMVDGVSINGPTNKLRDNMSKISATRPIIKNPFPCENKSSSKRLVVLALMAAERCPWRQPRRRQRKKGSLVNSAVGDKK
ncbi:hypothetical protein Salat_1864000 [Sesamum alatum]|uniref:Uncharacterized protein n=1 Tax=Sesamum alatum TaxID=300844 RepID=A0AAE1Y342_9LAMI|nr:hypothetical protein Salat_1864000 [Sesamum alatum]